MKVTHLLLATTILLAGSAANLSAQTNNCLWSDPNTDVCLSIQVHDQHGNTLSNVETHLCARADYVVTTGACLNTLQTWYTNSNGWVYWQPSANASWVIIFTKSPWEPWNPKWFYSPPSWNINQSVLQPLPGTSIAVLVLTPNSLPSNKMLYTTATTILP